MTDLDSNDIMEAFRHADIIIIIIIIFIIIIVTLQTVWGMSAWVNWSGGVNLEVQMTVWGTNSTEGAAHVIVHQNIEPNEQDSSKLL